MGTRCHDGRNSRSLGKASQANEPTRAWRFPFRSVTRYSTCSIAVFGRGSFCHDPVEESAEHPEAGSVPAVVAEHVLVQVRLKVLGRDSVIDPAYPTLHERPET